MKLNYHKFHKGAQSQALHNVSFSNNCPDPSLWNSQVGRREFLGKIGKASVGTAIVLNGLKLEVMASGSGVACLEHWKAREFEIDHDELFESEQWGSREECLAFLSEWLIVKYGIPTVTDSAWFLEGTFYSPTGNNHNFHFETTTGVSPVGSVDESWQGPNADGKYKLRYELKHKGVLLEYRQVTGTPCTP